ncbi:hypothetical protein M409DRAFT_59215 [Zasmidium cellare ATCC 36951]|uniref:C2H2-type domain-containing protein n=1 Tax=Zasmidium cellare ATCC 36951 TaxID=1080233 RepID=A0A6A6C637_ZASCE|nr:uncharacterized protein M409DRAFT_59215 [Zasmidium cellare ATCC 36951]KAF2161209.1 hypothetical protein M409DRAFT_59215 [Zasmidium cellare ATCC 36951]
MSSTTNTPTRPARGIPVPGIDTRGPAEKAAASLSFSGWPLTPPQSAHESRRPSLAYSALSDASHSGPSSVGGYSQPATPVHAMNQHNDVKQQWSDGTDVHASMSASLADTCSTGQVPQHNFASAFQQLSMCGANAPHGLSTYTPQGQHQVGSYGLDMSSDSPMRGDTWSQPQQISTAFNGHPGLRTTLFQSTQGLGQDSGSMYANPSHSVHTSLGASAFPNYDTAGPTLDTSFYQAPQVVVPSQLSPHEDYPMEQYSGYDQQEVEDGFTQSFDSSASSYNGWETMEPPSPQEAYFTKNEDDDFIAVKYEPSTPSRGPSRSQGFFESGPSQTRPRRRGSKRGRKSQAEGKCWYQANVCNMEVRYKGPRFSRLQSADGSIQYVSEERKETKPHKCTFKDADGNVCISRFDRSEHLKRHMSKHSEVRDYPCPLHDCDKKIARPDNAADHFRTHLRKPVKGKRNKHCTFERLQEAILQEYPDKTATKLLNNLRKWYEAEREREEIAEMEKRVDRERKRVEQEMCEREEVCRMAGGRLY